MEKLKANKEIIETKRLVIKPVSTDYALEAYEDLGDDVTKYMAFSSPKTVNDQLDFKDNIQIKYQSALAQPSQTIIYGNNLTLITFKDGVSCTVITNPSST